MPGINWNSFTDNTAYLHWNSLLVHIVDIDYTTTVVDKTFEDISHDFSASSSIRIRVRAATSSEVYVAVTSAPFNSALSGVQYSTIYQNVVLFCLWVTSTQVVLTDPTGRYMGQNSTSYLTAPGVNQWDKYWIRWVGAEVSTVGCRYNAV